MIKFIIDTSGTELRKLSETLSDLLSHSQINDYFLRCNIENNYTQTKQVNGTYITGTNKKDKIYNGLANSINKDRNSDKMILFLESIFNPANYVDKIEKFRDEVNKVNPVLMMMGVQIDNSGKIIECSKPTDIDEISERLKKLKNEIEKRNMHPQIKKYCQREYVSDDYFHTIVEATKGMLERFRELSGSKKDGAELINEILNESNPVLVFNNLTTVNEKNEYKGFKSLALGIVSMYRNPTAHTPRLLYKEDINITLDVLSTISLIHRYLDFCQTVRIL